MIAPAPDRYTWHCRPKDFDSPCPVCGCPIDYAGEHRTVRSEVGLRSQWVRRRKSARGHRSGLVARDNAPAKPAKVATVPRKGLPAVKTRESIATATPVLAAGRPTEAIATELGLTHRAVVFVRVTKLRSAMAGSKGRAASPAAYQRVSRPWVFSERAPYV
jgi:hypothetical protein